jgi:hypothetical protein
MVEAFSLRGLGRLAESWKQDPPFPGDNAFGDAIADYRQNVIRNYSKLAAEQGLINDPAAWFANHRREIEPGGLIPFGQAASLGSTDSAADRSALFVGFTATMAERDFSCPCIIGYGSSPSRCGPPYS